MGVIETIYSGRACPIVNADGKSSQALSGTVIVIASVVPMPADLQWQAWHYHIFAYLRCGVLFRKILTFQRLLFICIRERHCVVLQFCYRIFHDFSWASVDRLRLKGSSEC